MPCHRGPWTRTDQNSDKFRNIVINIPLTILPEKLTDDAKLK